ncbi:MAG: hypothetical protein H0V48_02350 [Nocardioidaceae bacterium]|nr:hypothetical protein [Nocardioidaceae bacterium]
MDNSTILWIVIGVAVLLVIIAIIYAVTRNNSDDTRHRPPQRRGGVGRDVDAPRPAGDREVDPNKRRRRGRPPRE